MGMSSPLKLAQFGLMLLSLAAAAPSQPELYHRNSMPSCKCTPGQSCWPSERTWSSLNHTVGGHLVKSVPVAQSCYPGPQYNAATCAEIAADLTNSTFIAANPIALGYPMDPACPPVIASAGQEPTGQCKLGNVPVYSVDARSAQEVAKGISFARNHNIRLVVRNTGHDILGRSTGYGSMQVWLHNLKNGIEFQQNYQPSQKCGSQKWTGSSMKVGGGYVWGDIYPMAAQHNVVVVGGGDPSVGISGGWMQGGGHSPASRDFGLGADQLLEATVVTAGGKIVTASACLNQDLFFALRGGGGGNYGVITSATIKAHPSPKVSAQTLAIAPLSPDNMDAFMEAVAIIYESYPSLFKAGYSGYGTWSIASPAPLFANFTTGFVHAIAMFNQPISTAQSAFAPLHNRLSAFNNTKLVISETYLTFPSYAAYYQALSGAQSPVGTVSALGSRLLDTQALTKDPEALRQMLNVTAGTPEEATSNNICLVAPAPGVGEDPYSGVNPAWRGAIVHNIVARGWAPGSDQDTIDAVHRDITYNKNLAQARLSPGTGAYMNEGDVRDPLFAVNFYGRNLGRLERVKRSVDPGGVFYCATCVGSWAFVEDVRGAVCGR